MSFKRIIILLEKEFQEFYSSRAWIIALVLPLFIAFLFANIYRETENVQYKLAYNPSSTQPQLIQILSVTGIKMTPYNHLNPAKKALAARKVDGILYQPDKHNPFQYNLQVPSTESKKASIIINQLNVALIRLYSHPKIPQINLEITGKKFDIRWVALPLWLIQIILTVCLLQNTAVIAEEKAKQTFHSLLVSPVTLIDYMSAKIIWNIFIGIASIGLTVILTGFKLDFRYLLLFSFSGCLVYSAGALMIGLLSPNALFARTVSTLTYLISSIPLMAKNTSLKWEKVLNIFPTFAIQHGLENAILQSPFKAESFYYLLLLLVETVLIVGISLFVLKKKIDL